MERIAVVESDGPRGDERGINNWFEVPRVPVEGEVVAIRDNDGNSVEAEVVVVVFEVDSEHTMDATVHVERRRGSTVHFAR